MLNTYELINLIKFKNIILLFKYIKIKNLIICWIYIKSILTTKNLTIINSTYIIQFFKNQEYLMICAISELTTFLIAI